MKRSAPLLRLGSKETQKSAKDGVDICRSPKRNLNLVGLHYALTPYKEGQPIRFDKGPDRRRWPRQWPFIVWLLKEPFHKDVQVIDPPKWLKISSRNNNKVYITSQGCPSSTSNQWLDTQHKLYIAEEWCPLFISATTITHTHDVLSLCVCACVRIPNTSFFIPWTRYQIGCLLIRWNYISID